MKVLFAVSSESISEAIIKRYQKEYKEILSYKNVYYFNAILKEIQKDKTYDRIIISEDLEPFSNNNYDTIDKFIFEKLDSISDEAQDSQGKETSIILICTDRRVKGNSILVKLFGIGVYNALLGNDRSINEVCKLISKPRTKKEAKMYYRIDTEDVSYKAEKENEVSEIEIQNILAHFKKLGKNTSKYCESFNNIAIQYTDEQLKIIVNCLPINVKAVLESDCQRYQELMAITGGIRSVKGMVADDIEGTIRKEINEKKIGQASKITKPIVIPSAVRNAKNSGSPIARKVAQTVSEPVETQVKKVQRPVEKSVQSTEQTVQISNNEKTTISQTNKISNQNVMVQRKVTPTTQVQPQIQTPKVEKQDNLTDNLLPDFDDFSELEIPSETINNHPVVDTNKIVKELSGFDELEENMETEETVSKRGRGRPRKTPVSGVEVKPKGKRGRPKKVTEEPEELEIEETMLPGMDYDDIEEELLPGFEHTETVLNEEVLPGMEFDEIEEENLDSGISIEDSEELLPDFEIDNNDEMLPGFEVEDNNEELLLEFENIDSDEILPGFETLDVEEELIPGDEQIDINEEILPTFEEEYTEEVSFPELDELDDVEDLNASVLPEFDEIESDDIIEDELLPEIYLDENEDELLPGFSAIDEADSEEETLLPGMGFEEDYNADNVIPTRTNKVELNYETNSLESIKPRVDYSMSSLNSLITKDKKIVTFIGTSKNGVSFLVNNLAALFSSVGINTAILDMTQNRNSYYIYTKNEEELRNIAFNSIEKLQNGYAEGIKVDKNLTVYTALPSDGKDYSNAEPILSTLVQNHSLVLIDCDYDTDLSYFASCQEMYLVQSMDILTIQPLTAFLRELKTKGILEPEKIRVVVNKELKVRSLSIKAIIGGLSYYNDPAMSFMTELFNRDIVKACTIPFEDNVYSKYLEGIVNCSVSLNGYSKAFLAKLKILGDMVYPLTSKQSYNRTSVDYNKNAFSSSMNDTLNKMRKKY